MDNSTQKTSVYRYFNEEHKLLYVGITKNQFGRLDAHSKTQPWWDEVAYGTFTHYEDRQKALEAETNAIGTEFPKYNKAGPVLDQESQLHLVGLMASEFDDEFHAKMSESMRQIMGDLNSFTVKVEGHKLLFAFGESIPWDDEGEDMLIDCIRCQSIVSSKWFNQQFAIVHGQICDEFAA